MTEADEVIDTTGLSCPLPVLKSKKALKGLEVGKVLKIISSDVGSKKDIPAWSRVTSQELLEETEEDGKYIFFVKKLK